MRSVADMLVRWGAVGVLATILAACTPHYAAWPSVVSTPSSTRTVEVND